jgi:hypothetical protein
MNVMTKGFLGLLFWLVLGFGLTEMTVLTLNAWLNHESHPPRADTVAAIKLEPHD